MNYPELLKNHQNEADTFSKDKIYFIFGIDENDILSQFNDNGLKPEEVTSIGAGGYIKTQYLPEFKELIKRQSKEKKEYLLGNIYEVVYYSCKNYEININFDLSFNDMLTQILKLSEEEIQENQEEIQRAYQDYRNYFLEN